MNTTISTTDGRDLQYPNKRRRAQNDRDTINGSIDQLIQNDIITISSDDTIASLTNELESLNAKRAGLLVARAKVRTSNGELTNAVSDALKAIECDPTLTEAYLVAGNLYSAQSKEQEALNIYERGLCAVLPSGWPLLYEKREVSREQTNRRIDFVKKLPLEITEAIFVLLLQSLPFVEFIRYAKISKLWRDTILHRCPALWATINVSDTAFHDPTSKFRMLPSITTQVRHLDLYDPSDRIIERIITMIQSDDKLSLVKHISLKSLPSLFESRMPLVNVLRNSLTKLTIDLVDIEVMYPGQVDPTMFSLDSIMSLCPKLEYLSLKSHSPVTYQQPQSPPPDGYGLQTLCLDIRDRDEVLTRLVPHCPRIQALVTRSSPSPHTVSLIHRYCLQLKYLGTIPERFHYDSIMPLKASVDRYYQASRDNVVRNTPGLEYFDYYGPFTRDILPLLVASKDTLRVLRLREIQEWPANMDQIAFNHVTILCLSFQKKHIEASVSILQQCTMLEQVYLHSFDRDVALDNFCTSLTAHRHLRILKLQGFQTETTATALEHLFIHYASQHQTCKLQQIGLFSCIRHASGSTALEALADITTLQSIELRKSFDGVEKPHLATFVQKLGTMPLLKSLSLHGMSNVSNDMLVDLAKVDGLKSLGLVDLDGISSYGIYKLADSIHSLKMCTVSCDAVKLEAASYLEKKASKSWWFW